MSSGLSKQDMQTILQVLEKYPEVETAVLYGSRALGTYQRGSDIDIALKGRKLTSSICSHIHFELEEETLLPYFFDITDYQSVKNEKLKEHIDRVGKVIYGDDNEKLKEDDSKVLWGWVKTTLGEMACTNISSINNDFKHKVILYLDTGSITKGKIENLQKIKTSAAPSRAKRLVKHEDIIYSTVRPNQEHYGYIVNPQENLVVSTGFTVIENNKGVSSSNFLYYFLTQKKITNELQQTAEHSTSAYPSIKPNDLERIELFLPPLPEQTAIARVLSSLDAKIELLQEQNQTLEKIAQTLFKQWFVDFNFPDENGKPYKDIGGEMVGSELGDIPKDWKIYNIDQCVSTIIDYRGKTPIKLGQEWVLNGIPALSAKNIKNGKIVRKDSMYFGDENLYHSWMKEELIKNDIILTSEAPLGELYYLTDNSKYILSQRLFALRSHTVISSVYLYFWLKSFKGQYLLKRRATGSTVVRIRQEELRKVEIIIPGNQIVSKASSIWNELMSKINSNAREESVLSKIRDILLPKLMSGQIRVSD